MKMGMKVAMSILATVTATAFLALLPWTSSLTLSNSNTHCNHCNCNCNSNRQREKSATILKMSDDWSDAGNDSNKWTSSSSSTSSDNDNGSFWSTFESSEEEWNSIDSSTLDEDEELLDDSEVWLDTLAAISAEEVRFNQKDNDRADKARQMQEWGFDDQTIQNTFDIAVDDSKETADEPLGLKEYRDDLYGDDASWDDEEYDDIESHTRVEVDDETGEPIRQQMVYVDEHACIGCTNCATIADSTFFMESWYGRARVYNQWGDTEDTIAMAIETCPVDCIHYVPYEELKTLEIERREQLINNQARLVNQGESAHMAGVGGGGFSMAPKISGNSRPRCNNCPSKGCKTCPMFGVGKNPAYEKRERERLARIERSKLERERAANSKSAEL